MSNWGLLVLNALLTSVISFPTSRVPVQVRELSLQRAGFLRVYLQLNLSRHWSRSSFVQAMRTESGGCRRAWGGARGTRGALGQLPGAA